MARQRSAQRLGVAWRAKITLRRAAIGVVCLLPILVIAIHAIASRREQGVLNIQIKDHRDAIGDFAELTLTIDKILISPRAGMKFWQTGWKELAANPSTVDLTRVVDNHAVRVYRGAMDVGDFDGFHLKIKAIEGRLKSGRRHVAVKNNLGPVQLPFQIRSQKETLLIIDLVVTDFSDHPPRGYELGIKGYQLLINGKLIAKIPPG